MELSDAVQEVKERWRDFLPLVLDPAKEKVNGETSYVCPFCGHGSHGDGLTFNKKHPEHNTLHCFNEGCGFSGSDIDMYARMQGRDISDSAEFVEVVKEMAGMLNIMIDDKQVDLPPKPKKTDQPQTVEESIVDPPPAPERKPNTPNKYINRILYAAENLHADAGKDALNYLHGRGLTDETLKRFSVGFRPTGEYFVRAHKEMPAITFPHDAKCSYYSSRSIDYKFFNKPGADEAGDQPLFNWQALERDKAVFIVEGQIDALSIMQCGGCAAALAGGGWESVLMPQISRKPPKMPLILALDNDPPDENGQPTKGQKAQAELAAALDAEDVPYIVARFSLDKYGKEVKDCNDMLQADPAQLEKDVKRIEAEALQPDNTQDYVLQEMQRDIEALRQDARRKTGWENLDAILGSLYSGLIIAGGLPGMGKTSWMLQLCDQLAAAGHHILFFSLEMSRLELVSKSISRMARQVDERHAVTGLQIRLGAKGDAISQGTQAYIKAVGSRVSICEGNFDCDVAKIRSYTQDYVAYNHVVPIIMLDYVQILSPPTDARGRQATDPRVIVNENITQLKRLSRELQTPVIVISSMNRANYTSPLSFESFRESGALEYSADVVLGLELCCMDEDIFTKDKDLAGKRKRIQEARAELPRKIRLMILKNRYGRSNVSCQFDYFPQYDTFLPAEEEFRSVPEGVFDQLTIV